MNKEQEFLKEKPLKLFLNVSIPTVIAMLVSALYIIADGIFIGKGIGPSGLAAVNIIVPIFTVITGISMLLGFGSSTLSAIELSKKNKKNSDEIIGQTFSIAVLVMLALTSILFLFSNRVSVLLGSNDAILSMSSTYLKTMIVFGLFFSLSFILPYFMRLDGGAKYAMLFSTVGGVINIVFDYHFIFNLKWGVFGAALATGIGNVVASISMIVYLVRYSPNIKLRVKAMKLSVLKRVARIGFPGLLTEFCISAVTVGYNIVLMREIGEVGVSAYSVINYLHPLVLLLFMGISQSVQPLVSYNFGAGRQDRVNQFLKISLVVSGVIEAIAVGIGFTLKDVLVSSFLDKSFESYSVAISGLPLFFTAYVFLGINMVSISYFQSITEPNKATIITLLRGLILVLVFLLTLPQFIGVIGIWLSVPLAEAVGGIVSLIMVNKHKINVDAEGSVIYA